MESAELKTILADVASKTGIAISLRQAGEGETPIFFPCGGKMYEAAVEGCGEEGEKLAKLISYLVSSAEPAPASDKREELRKILLGDGASWRVHRFMTKYSVTDGACFCVDALPDKHMEEALAHIERCVDERAFVLATDEKHIAVIQFVDEEQTPYEFGQFLSQSLYEELGVRASIGVGCEARSFTEIAESYAQAATALRMSGIFHAEGEVHSYREYLLVRMLEDVPRSRLKDYVEQFRIEGAEEVFDDEDMTATAEAFLESSLNVSETSRNLFMHRNTLTYRLDKIQRATGLNIRKFSDAVTFRTITILYKLLQS